MTEDDVRLENVTLEIKKSYKHALENLDKLKKDTADVLSIKENVERDLAVAQKELHSTKNEISQEKLGWASEKHLEMVELENKQSEAENVLRRKAELNHQEEAIRLVEAKNIEVLNETRRLELEIKERERVLQVDKRAFEDEKKKVEELKVKLAKDKEEFKKKVILTIKEVENL